MGHDAGVSRPVSYLSRLIDPVLDAWYALPPPRRKPLILRGARQTGKSSSVRALGRRTRAFVELNLERWADRELVRSCRGADELLKALAVREDVARLPDDTLLFLDEVQEALEIIPWLRFLHEDEPRIAVITTGSLLEVRLHEGGFSFPVGRVTFRELQPFSFFEFLAATGRATLRDEAQEAARARAPLARPLHDEALARLGDYLLVGGMPEAVVRWRGGGGAAAVREVHEDLLTSFAEDIPKYGRMTDPGPIEAAFAHAATHYGRRFSYENFAPGYRSHPMKRALHKLEGARVVRRVWPTDALRPPLETKAKSSPRLLPLDVGLGLGLGRSGVDALDPAQRSRWLDGPAAEVLVGNQLLCATDARSRELFFWVRQVSKAQAETDYLVPSGEHLIPIEVKSGSSGSMKSMHQFLWRSGAPLGVRLYAGPWRDDQLTVRMPDGELGYRLLSLPLYLAEMVDELVRAS
jgi:uncharacterized protein